jgi:hypothetical protein
MLRPRAFALLLALAALRCPADEVRIVSGAPDEVSITIYRDLFALVTETRTVDLPAGPLRLEFDGVVESLLPQSARVADTGRAIAESNYDFEKLTPGSLIRHSIGKTVTLTRTHPRTGRVRQVTATIVAAGRRGVTFRTVDGNEAYQCSGLPEQLTFEQIPDGIDARPRLSIRLADGPAGKRRVRVSYLAYGFAWGTDYLGHLDDTAQRLDLLGWVTLRNMTGATFRNAQVQVVAGRLNLLDREEGGSSLVGDTGAYSTDEGLAEALAEVEEYLGDELADAAEDYESVFGCYPQGPPVFPAEKRAAVAMVDAISAEDIGRMPDGEEIQEVIVTGFRGSMAVREELADYQMYRLPNPTDLNARQTKQVAFIRKKDVKIDRFYAIRFSDADDFEGDHIEEEGGRLRPAIRIAWMNREADGLGEPLPAGRVRIFDGGGTSAVFAGEADIRDNPVGGPVEFTIGNAQNLALTPELPADDEPQARWTSLLTRRVHLPVRMSIENDKPLPVVVEVRQGPVSEFREMRVRGASQSPQRKNGDYLWRIEVPAHGAAHLSYTLSGRSTYED